MQARVLAPRTCWLSVQLLGEALCGQHGPGARIGASARRQRASVSSSAWWLAGFAALPDSSTIKLLYWVGD
jgi:hypothetical protein